MKLQITLQEIVNNIFINEIKNGDRQLADELLLELGYELKVIDDLAEKIYKRQIFLIKVKIKEQNNV